MKHGASRAGRDTFSLFGEGANGGSETIMSGDRLHNMKAVELRTGLSAHVIRIWERRYGAVTPARSDTQRRLYTEAEVDRLHLLSRLTHSGLAISQIAQLPTDELRLMQDRTLPAPVGSRQVKSPAAAAGLLDSALEAVRRYDNEMLEKTLDRGMVAYGYAGLLQKLLIPLLQGIGDAWEAGDLMASQEHGATAALKDYLARNFRSMHPPRTAPRLLVTTPAGQLHEMGAAIAASLARTAGWNVTYLGPSLPAEEIVGAVMMNQFRAVALSIIYPADDPELSGQLLRLRRLLPEEIPIIIGGRAAQSYRKTIDEIGALMLPDMSGFNRLLDEVRNGNTAPPAGPGDPWPPGPPRPAGDS